MADDARTDAMLGHRSGSKSGGAGSELIAVWTFYRRWWLLLSAVTFCTVITASAYVWMTGVKYEVSAALYYKMGAELAPPPTIGKDPILITRRKEDVNNEIEILSSPHLVEQVIQGLGVGFFHAPPPTTALGRMKVAVKSAVRGVESVYQELLIQAGLRRRLSELESICVAVDRQLKVELARDSDVVHVTLTTPNPDAGTEILRKLLDAYLERHLAAHQESGVKEFFAEQTDDLSRRLAEASQKLLDYQTEHDLWSGDEQRKLLLDSRKILQLEHGATRRRSAFLKSEAESLGAMVEQLPETIELSRVEQLNPAIESLQDRVATLRLDQTVIEAAYTEGSREVSNRRDQLRGLQRDLDAQRPLIPHSTTRGANQARQELAKQLALKRAELDGMDQQSTLEQTQLTTLDEQLGQLEVAAAEYRQLSREHERLEQNYLLYAENLEKSRIASVMNQARISNLRVIAPPTASKLPVGPKLKLVLGAAMCAGIALGSTLALILDLRSIPQGTGHGR